MFWLLRDCWGVEKSVRRVVILTLVYLIPSFQAMLPVDDPDIWWHLRVGEWILEQHTVPNDDSFSAYGHGKPWVAYSWLFEVLVYGLYKNFGLSGLLLFTVMMSLVIALAVHRLIRPGGLPFLAEAVLLALTLGAMKPLMSPRPWLFSIVFFAAELIVLFHVRRTGRTAALLILPPLFILWANLHIQFLYGLIALGLFVLEAWLNFRWRRDGAERDCSPLPVGRLSGVALACVAAVFFTPYHYGLLWPIVEYSMNTGAFQNISELHPLFFRSPADWFVLVLTLGAVYTLGWQKRATIFPTLLLGMGAFLGFRAQRDTWVLLLGSAVILSEYRSFALSGEPLRLTKSRCVAIAAAVLLALYFIARHRQLSESHLETAVAEKFPVRAVHFVKSAGYSGRLYNTLDWGGYLIWSLPEIPVAMDGRTNLHGDERIARSIATWSGRPGWDSDPELMQANVVIADATRPLTSLLRTDSRFELVYEDATALVFVSAHQKP
jgi:hypothetical protein